MAITGTMLFRSFMLFCLLLNSTTVALPQTTTTGAVVGSIYEAGTPEKGVAGATVILTNEENGLERSAFTRPDGNYSFEFLPPNRYTITVIAPGYETRVIPNFVVRLSERNPVIPPIALKKIVVVSTQPPPRPPVNVGDRPSERVSGLEQLVNTTNATRGQNFDRRILETLPLPGVRTFDDLAFLAPGVAPPPQAIGNSVGPGLGAGVGTSGQFSVNGLRSRSNNYTIDGSDNNDEDIGVRRQGFTSLVPQTIESLQEFRIITLLPEPQFGRNLGAQVNAVSRSGGAEYHGILYGFFTDDALRARDVFDLTGGGASFTVTRRSDGRAVTLDGDPLTLSDPVDGENQYRRGQYGFVIGGPVVKKKLFFFGSVERQDINAERESHFAVPTVAERGLTLNVGGADALTGDTGISRGGFFGGPTSLIGDAFFSLFPFPNNPLGPYGANTYTEIIPADADGIVFSMKMDRPSLEAFGKRHNFTGRYNFTDDDTTLPVTGGAIFSSLTANVRAQNLSLFLTSEINERLSNEFRASYGRTSLGFQENRSSSLIPSDKFRDGDDRPQFLLNRPLLRNISRAGFVPGYVTLAADQTKGPSCDDDDVNADSTEDCTGPLGQLIVTGYSPVGVDVINFPQGRVNNTFQYADTLLYSRANQKLTAGADIRRIQLNSFLDRNFRPVAVFNGGVNVAKPRSGLPLPALLQGRDFVAVGAPTGFTQTLTTFPDSTIGLRSWQNDFFFSDQARLRPNLTVTLGARYQINTVPTEVTRRIEMTFDDAQAKSRLNEFLKDREKIYERDSNNIAPHVAFAWDPTGKGTTSVRAGYGLYYDQIPGAVVSQSRAVFPTFFTFNLAGISGLGQTRNPGLEFINPATITNPQRSLNTFTIAPGVDVIQSINDAVQSSLDENTPSSFANPDFVLPSADLVTPYSQHWGLSLEHSFNEEFFVSLGYVGTRGVHLLRFNTPNGGPNKILTVRRATSKLTAPSFEGSSAPPPRDQDKLGSFTSIESDANSIYHGLQLQLNKRLSRGIQFTTAYTWSHAIDEASDLFDLAGARALPQDSFDRRAERGDANFDVRHRFVYSFIYDLPGSQNDLLLGGWQVASIGTFQTGQPYSVYVPFDANKDGNLTDRVEPDGTQAGRAGRNLFRAPGVATVDLSLNKYFRFSEDQAIEFRAEVFNLFNRTNFGVPVNQLSFGGLGNGPTDQVFIDTRVPLRTIQFALKYKF